MHETFKTFRGILDFLQPKVTPKHELRNTPYPQRKVRVYNYSKAKHRNECVLEVIDKDALKYCMIGFGADMKVGELILLDERNPTLYKIEGIDYYLEPSDMWIALLHQYNP